MKKLAFVTGTAFAMVYVLGGLFKIMHWPGGNIMLMLATLLALIFIPAFARYKYLKSN